MTPAVGTVLGMRSLAEDEVQVFSLALRPEERNASLEELDPIDSLKGFRESESERHRTELHVQLAEKFPFS
jgi:hypothetical protein